MQQEQASLGRDREANLVRQLEAAAALEPFFREENLDMSKQLLPIHFRESGKKRKVALDD